MFSRKSLSLFFNAAGNANLVNTAVGGTVSTISYYTDPNNKLDLTTGQTAGTMAGAGAAALGMSFIKSVIVRSDYSKGEKAAIIAGTAVGEFESAIIATVNYTTSAFPDNPILTFTISNGMLAAINKSIASLLEVKETPENTPLLRS